MPLKMAPLGEEVEIKRLAADDKVKRHLENLGLAVGQKITVLSAEGGARHPQSPRTGVWLSTDRCPRGSLWLDSYIAPLLSAFFSDCRLKPLEKDGNRGLAHRRYEKRKKGAYGKGRSRYR